MGTRETKEIDPQNGVETYEFDPCMEHKARETIRDVEIVILAFLFLWAAYLSHKWFTNKKKNKTENQNGPEMTTEPHNTQDPAITSTMAGGKARHEKNDETTTCYTFDRDFENYWSH